MRAFAKFAVILASTLAALPTLADEPKGDLARLQGTWSAKVGPDKNIPITLIVKGNAIELKVVRPDNEEIKLSGEIKLDENASPKTSDWIKFTAPDGQEIGDNKAIYKLEGDSWTTCSGGPGNDRPTKFEQGEGGPPNLTVWTRVKETPPKPSDLARMQGTWTASAGAGDEVVITLTVQDARYVAKWDRGDGTAVELKGDIKIDEKASPRKIDFVNAQRNDGEDARDNLGLYDFEGEHLRICVGGAGNDRPTALKKPDDGAGMLLIFSKKK